MDHKKVKTLIDSLPAAGLNKDAAKVVGELMQQLGYIPPIETPKPILGGYYYFGPSIGKDLNEIRHLREDGNGYSLNGERRASNMAKNISDQIINYTFISMDVVEAIQKVVGVK